MKIAVLGSRGFVGSSITNFFKLKCNVTPITRDTLDLLNPIVVKDFLKEQKFDVIINCAAIMTDNNSIFDARNNLGIFLNFYNNATYFGKFINTGSGAEFDREQNIDHVPEELIFSRLPKDSYGFGQNVKSRLCYEKENFYTLRIFNCFGNKEQKTRLFPRILENNSEIKITNDRYFDYFSVHDLLTLTDHCIENNWTIKDCNCSYETKYKISEVAKLFCRLHNTDKKVQIESDSQTNYTGDYKKIKSLNVNLLGLEKGLEYYFNEENKL